MGFEPTTSCLLYIRTQCKLENKLSNSEKIIIKTKCYFLVIFRSLPLLFPKIIYINFKINYLYIVVGIFIWRFDVYLFQKRFTYKINQKVYKKVEKSSFQIENSKFKELMNDFAQGKCSLCSKNTWTLWCKQAQFISIFKGQKKEIFLQSTF